MKFFTSVVRRLASKSHRPVSKATKRLNLERLEERDQPAALYPSIDGTGHNPSHTDWGSTGIDLLRRAAAAYADGVSSPAGANRPGARVLSNALVALPEGT